MKFAEEWQEKDLLLLIAEKAEESNRLEFKDAGALQKSDRHKREISKDVSAFANSAGGTIIYGIKESAKAPRHAEALAPIDPSEVSKDWLDQVLNSTIQPRVSSVFINPVELVEKHPGKYCYVVVVPESDTAHQASDKRYYKRFNFQSVAMEDYEVRQAMSRGSRPAYKVELQASTTGQGNPRELRFQGILENVSEIVGRDVSAVVFVPVEFIRQADDFRTYLSGIEYSRISGEYVVSSHDTRTAVDSAHPFTPYAIQFRKTVAVIIDPLPAERFTVVVKVYDQFGLSLTATFHVQLPSCTVALAREVHGARRAPGPLVGGELT